MAQVSSSSSKFSKARGSVTDWTKDVRPTTGKTLEAFWNIVRHRHPETHTDWASFAPEVTFIDLFAGLGHVTQSAIQMGCGKVYAVEKHPKRCRHIQENTSKYLPPTQTLAQTTTQALQVIQADVCQWVKRPPVVPCRYPLVYIDPPYELPPAVGLHAFWWQSILQPLTQALPNAASSAPNTPVSNALPPWWYPPRQPWGMMVLECRAKELEALVRCLDDLRSASYPHVTDLNFFVDFQRVYGEAGLIFLSQNGKVNT
jgi:16S rRNA G966 N2-methylase RsmD